ncbi:MAG: DMT family transporter [Rhodospirillaceae bacterium]
MPLIPASVATAYKAIPPPVRAIVFMMLSGICVTGMNASVKAIALDIHPFVIAFFRHAVGVCLLTPMFLGRGANPLRTARLGLHGLRAMLNVAAMLAYFMALTMVPLATTVALSFTAPLFATLGAMLFLREKVSAKRSVALAVGFSGALVILRPWAVEVETGALLLLFSSTVWAVALIVIKILSRTESSLTITLYASLLQIPFAFVAALFFWTWPTAEQLAVLVFIAICGTGAQLTLSQAFREADATIVLPADFTKLIFAGIAGWLFFAEAPEIWIWIGGTVVFAGVLLSTLFDRRDRQVAKAVAPAGETPQIRPNSGETEK